MSKIKIAFTDIKDIEKDFLKNNTPENCEFIIIPETLQDTDIEKIKDVEILSVFINSRVHGDLLNKFTNLKMITTRSTGYNHIDIEYCNKNNILAMNVPKYGECTIAEFAFGLLLDLTRKINVSYENLKSGKINMLGYIGNDLNEKIIGIIGTGSIGCHAIKIAHGFGMKILAYDPYPQKKLEEKFGVKYADIDELYKESDIISLHTPLTKESYHLLNNEAFSKMKKGVIIINTARGEIIDTEALYKAITNETVSAAGLDVVECENILIQEEQYLLRSDDINRECLVNTLINHKLLSLPNVIITPHIAFDSIEAIQRILKITMDNINGYLFGNIINKV
ncbi:MAG: NAD(P)-dependent oxidoreductase, partial [bacterium]